METSQSAVLMRPLQIFTTGKSIEIDRRSWAQGLFEVSALSVVVNAQADARRRASEEQGACIQAGDQHRPPQQAQTISEWLKKQMGAGGIPAHNR